MNMMKQASRRPSTHLYALPLLLMLLIFGASPGTAQAQWTTGTDITNTNTGNVGIGTASPTTKLDVNGTANFSGPTTVAGRGIFSIDGSNNLNLSMYNHFKINASAVLINGAFETHDNYFGVRYTPSNVLTVYVPASGSAFFNQGNVGIGTTTPNGKLDVVGASGAPNYANGLTGLLRVGASNEHIEFGYVAGNRTWIQGFGAVPLFINEGGNNVIFNATGGNVGIGMTLPTYKLDVNGEINATGLRINGTPIGTGGGSSPWTTGSGSVYYNTGNVGIGTASPSAARLHLHSPSDTYLRIGAPLASQSSIAFNDDTNGQDIVLYRPGGTRDFAIWTATANNVFTINQSGNVGIGTVPTATNKLEVLGSLNVTGTIKGGVIEAKYQDVAEWVESSQKLEAGTVVALDPEKSNQVLASSQPYDTSVAGVVSAQPGISLGERGEGKVLVATTGRVKVKVDARRAPIKIGDLLVTSEVAGVAMKSEPVSFGGRQMHAPGTIIGKALEPLQKGTGEILVLLSMQ